MSVSWYAGHTNRSYLGSYTLRSVARHRALLSQLRSLRQADSEWFLRNPGRIVRFRPERKADFASLFPSEALPTFIPHQLDAVGPLNWVAVVDVHRAINIPVESGALRSRVRTLPIRSRRLQLCLEEEFAIAVCQELLNQLHSTDIPIPTAA